MITFTSTPGAGRTDVILSQYYNIITNTYFQNEGKDTKNYNTLHLRGDGTKPYVILFGGGGERLKTTSAGVTIEKNLTITTNDNTKEGGEIRLNTSDGGQMFIDAYGKGNDSKVRIHSNGTTHLEIGPSGVKVTGDLEVNGKVNDNLPSMTTPGNANLIAILLTNLSNPLALFNKIKLPL